MRRGVALFLLLSALIGPGAGPPTVSAADPCVLHGCAIEHVIIMDKENRTFDSMFGRFPGVDGATTYRARNGSIHPLTHQPDTLVTDIGHTIGDARLAMDGGKLDRFNQLGGAIQHSQNVADSQFYRSDIPNYWRYAQTYTLDDHFFSTIMGNSFANHLFTIAGQDANVDGSPSGRLNAWGCDSPKSAYVEQERKSGVIRYAYPCFDFQTIGDELDAHHLAWTYFAPPAGTPGYFWNSFDAIIRNPS